MNYDIKITSYPLPEAVENAVFAGYLDKAELLIDEYLKKEIPEVLRKRLELEKYLMHRRAMHYTYTYDDAEKMLKEHFEKYESGLLRSFIDQGLLDWCYKNGEIYLEDRILENAEKRCTVLKENKDNPDLNLRDEFIERLEKSGKVEARVKVKETLKIHGTKHKGKRAHVNIPLAKEIEGRLFDISLDDISPSPSSIDPPGALKRTISFDNTLKGDDEFSATFTYTIKEEKRAFPSSGGYLAEGMDEYLKEEAPHILFTPYLKDLSAEITKGKESMVEKAEAIYRFITERVLYSFVRPYATYKNISEFTASSLKGDCGMQALLFITLCRISNIPASWESGWYVTPLSVGSHDWAKINICGIWYPIDCSFGGGAYREGNIKRQKHYFGNLDTFRMIANSTNFAPLSGKKALSQDPTDNQVGEVEVEGEPLFLDEYENQREVISYEFI